MATGTINWNPSRRVLRQFGAAGFVVFTSVGVYLLVRGGGVAATPVSLGQWIGSALVLAGLSCGVLALAAPRALRGVYLGMTIAAWPIGWVVSHVALGIIFYGIFTPMALWFRLIGRDVLGLKLDRQIGTYWMPRGQREDVRSYFRQS